MKSYEYKKGEHLTVTDADFKKANPRVVSTIETEDFINPSEMNPIFFEKPYYLVPTKNGEKGYRLLQDVMDSKTYKIISFKLYKMTAKGHLVNISRKKYGCLEEKRPEGWRATMNELTPIVSDRFEIKSDMNPHYPKYIKEFFPNAIHTTVKGKLGAVIGQGEMKKIGFDPLFVPNHTCAALRDNINRLVRKTWATTKLMSRLNAQLDLYVWFHNEVLLYQNLKKPNDKIPEGFFLPLTQ